MAELCTVCKKIFSTRYNLNKHLRNVHDIMIPISMSHDKSAWSNKCLEEKCDSSYFKGKDLMEHLKKIHSLNFEIEERQFNDFKEFTIWKCAIEEQNMSNYIVSSREQDKHGKIITYYACNRTGKKSQSKEVFKRVTKTQGSCKINSACTSKIKLLKNINGSFSAIWNKTHYGHSAEVQHLRISKQQRSSIASKLINGVSVTKILDSNRDKIGEELKRTDLLVRQDVANIKSSYNLIINEGVKHTDDATSIDLWVEECKNSKENPVLFYKRQGEESHFLQKDDFCLVVMNNFQEIMLKKFGKNIISIDSTHGLNRYDFELTTLMVTDEFNEGFPVAFLFSNRKDTYIFNLFFENIKSKVGVIQPITFMSDITPVFYTAWSTTMGPVQFQLWCSWHVDRAWQTNVRKINDKEKRTWVYKTLKVIQKETDQSKFHVDLTEAIKLMVQDKETKTFGLYFQGFYEATYSHWAYSYRKGCNINTNMRLESMHKILKHIYLDGKTVKRLDKGLHALLKLIRDKSVQRIIKLTKGSSSSHISDIHRRHRSALTSKFNVKEDENKSWTMENETGSYYTIEKKSILNCCNIVCSYCNICIHQYTCSCADYFIKSTICKHIHYVILNIDIAPKHNSSDTSTANEEKINFMSALAKQTAVKQTNYSIIKAEVSNTFSALQTANYEDMDDDVRSQIHVNLKNLNGLVNLSSKKIAKDTFKNIEPCKSANKNIEPQLRFHSTQRKRKVNPNHNKNPTKEEVEKINNLLSGHDLYTSRDSANDHAYF